MPLAKPKYLYDYYSAMFNQIINFVAVFLYRCVCLSVCLSICWYVCGEIKFLDMYACMYVCIYVLGNQALDIFFNGPESTHKKGIIKTFTHTSVPIHPRTLLKQRAKTSTH